MSEIHDTLIRSYGGDFLYLEESKTLISTPSLGVFLPPGFLLVKDSSPGPSTDAIVGHCSAFCKLRDAHVRWM
jgi:hypothetical protein